MRTGFLISFGLVAAVFAIFVLISGPAHAGPLDETRYCQIQRNPDGSIQRRADVLRAFKKLHPCPSTGKTEGPCPGWAIDHVIPLAKCGCDAISNLQWLKNEIKSCAGELCT